MQRFHKYKISIYVLLLCMCSGIVEAQETRSHEIGKLWETMYPTGLIPKTSLSPFRNQATYPGGDFLAQTKKNLRGMGLWVGVTNWADTSNTLHSWYVSEGGLENNEATGEVFFLPKKNKKKVRYRLPLVNVNETLEERLIDSRGHSTKSSTIPADERIETSWATNVGVQVKMTSYAYANQNHNSYIIRSYTFKNDGNVNSDPNDIELSGQDLSGVYFGFQYYLIPGYDRGHKVIRQDDDWAAYYGNAPEDTLRGLFYVFDGNAEDNYDPNDDTGDPDPQTGELLSPQYPGFGVLHADVSYNDDSDDLSQPATVDIKPRINAKSHKNGNSNKDLYAELSSGLQSRGTVDLAGVPYDAAVRVPIALLSFGPYDIPFGESVTVVLYEAVGSISQRQALSAGKAWKNGELDFDGLTGDEAKNALVASGKDSLFMHASRAEFAWRNGMETIPSPPPSPNLNIFSGPGKIELDWESVADVNDWQTKENDFVGYNVYRADDSWTNVYDLIATFEGDTLKYTDRDVERGKKYYYAVTTYDDGTQNLTGLFPGQPLESSPYSNRNSFVGAEPFEGARTDMDSIYVVPNPFHLQGLAFGGDIGNQWDGLAIPRLEDKISFIGLPAKATIRIFTMHGNLVATIEHPNPDNPNSIPESADEAWFQITDSYQVIKSGVYAYHVEGWDINDVPLGTATGKFIVIR
jgi:hypothetical protein